jgi:hypothetical protein
MSLWQILIDYYPELSDSDFRTKIILRNDADKFGDYIEKWHYEKPIPEGLKLGK